MGQKQARLFCASVNAVMVMLRWLVLRASILCVFTTSNWDPYQRINIKHIKKTCKTKPTSLPFFVTNTSSLPHIYTLCARHSLFLHTIIYLHFFWQSLHSPSKEMLALSLLQVWHTSRWCHSVGGSELAALVFLVLLSFLIHLLKSHDSQSTPFLSWKAPAACHSAPIADDGFYRKGPSMKVKSKPMSCS